MCNLHFSLSVHSLHSDDERAHLSLQIFHTKWIVTKTIGRISTIWIMTLGHNRRQELERSSFKFQCLHAPSETGGKTIDINWYEKWLKRQWNTKWHRVDFGTERDDLVSDEEEEIATAFRRKTIAKGKASWWMESSLVSCPRFPFCHMQTLVSEKSCNSSRSKSKAGLDKSFLFRQKIETSENRKKVKNQLFLKAFSVNMFRCSHSLASPSASPSATHRNLEVSTVS